MYKQFFIYNFNQLPLGAGTNIATGVVPSPAFLDTPVVTQDDADFEALKTAYTATDPRVFVRFKQSGGEYYDEDPGMDARLVCGQLVNLASGGNALLFKNLAHPMLVPAGGTFTIKMADFSGSSNNVRLAVHGTKLRPGQEPWKTLNRRYKDPMKGGQRWWTTPWYSGSISANASAPGTIKAPDRRDLYIYRISAQRTGAATIEIQDGFGENLQDTPTHLDNFCGNIAGYNILPAPIFVPALSSLVINITDISGATNGVTLHFEGIWKEF